MTDTHPVDPGRLLTEIIHLLTSSFGEFVPSDAQMHLVNAQRELLLAVALIIEHNASRTPRQPRGRRRTSTSTTERRPQRVELD